MNDNVKLILGNSLEKLKGIPDNSIDLTVTSPPYDNLRTYKGNNDLWNEDVWKGILKELYRVTKEGGVVVWVVGDATIKGSESGTSFKQALYAKEVGFNLHDTMIYHRNAMPNSSKRYNQDFEYMFIFTKGTIHIYNPIMVDCTYAGKGTSPTSRNKDGKLSGGIRRIIKDTKKASNIWYYVSGINKSTKDAVAHNHPAIFPEQLANDHIISWSNEGDTILDPFMGSGTTGKVAILNNRKFIGIELEEEYYNISKERIQEAINKQSKMDNFEEDDF